MSSSIGRLPGWAKLMLAEARVGRLGFLDDSDQPRVLPVTFALFEERLYSAVDEKPKRRPGSELARLRFLRRRPEAALLVDRYEDDWSELAWVQVLGRMELIEADNDRGGMESLVAKYEPYSERRPRGPLLRLDPVRAIWWRARGPETQ